MSPRNVDVCMNTKGDLRDLIRAAREYEKNQTPDRKVSLERAFDRCARHEVPAYATHYGRLAAMRDYDYPLPAECRIAECVIVEMPEFL